VNRRTFLASFPALAAAPPRYSELWGERGEKWKPQGRLPDFSYAGYHCGEDPLPDLPAAGGVNVRDFGARGNGEQDDTEAVLKAIAAVKRGVVLIPAGRYRITGILEIRKSHVVLRGEGPDRTTLWFPTPLNDIRPDWGATTGGARTSNYSWAGGFVWLRGETGRRPLATITSEARRGDTVLALSTTAGLQAGQRVQIEVTDDAAHTLTTHLYSDDPGDISKVRRTRASLVSRVRDIRGGSITLERPLRFDVKLAWNPRVLSFEPEVAECGVEHLHFEFPAVPYRGHFTELGFNPVALTRVADCWVRNLRISNPDSGPFVSGVFNTLQGLVYESARKPGPVFPDRGSESRQEYGHHGLYLVGADDSLFTGFDLRMTFIHDLSVSRGGGNVISNGKGLNINFDHHKETPYENLFTDIDAGEGTRLWRCGGGQALGRQCAARGTFWNIRARSPLSPPPPGWGPASMNLVGLAGQPDERVMPANIHEAQLSKRLRQRGQRPE